MSCAYVSDDCSQLDFKSMSVLERNESIVIVKCSSFERGIKAPITYGCGYCANTCPFYKWVDIEHLAAHCERDNKPIEYFDGFLAHCLE